jgi:transposase
MKPYSLDLRSRMFNYSLTHTVRETAKIFSVSPNTIQLLRNLFYETGQLGPRPKGAVRPRAVSEEGELFLKALLLKEVDLTLEELRERYAQTYGVTVSRGAMHDTLQRLGLTLKKKSTYDPKKDIEEIQLETEQYHQQVDDIPLDDRLYLDETGARLNMTLPYGRSPQGERVYDEKPTSPGETVSTVAVLTPQGLERPWRYQGSLTAQWFVAYLDVYLLPLLLTGKVLIMDNHPVHRSRWVQSFLKRHNIRYIFLPRYSPELNPIEEAWSKFKQYLKRAKARTLDDLLEAMDKAAKTISSEDSLGYFQHVEDFSLVIN